jgi:putative flippase GtrA
MKGEITMPSILLYVLVGAVAGILAAAIVLHFSFNIFVVSAVAAGVASVVSGYLANRKK